jgi:hypothetical protein
LPKFFIELLSNTGDTVYDPFSGRGTTVLEAGLLGRRIAANDANPLSALFSRPRFEPPTIEKIEERLASVPIDEHAEADIDLSMFYHSATEAEIVSLKDFLQSRKDAGQEDDADRWIRMAATNRLTGHSPGFFSVYTLPPNQAVSPASQRKINERLKQRPEYRDVRALILKKSRALLGDLTPDDRQRLLKAGESARFLSCDARATKAIGDQSVQLTVTSPPFLDVVDYTQDNWLRCWFNGIDAEEIEKKITSSRTPEEWSAVMFGVFRELFRVTKPRGFVAFEVGEVKKKIMLDEIVAPLGMKAGFKCIGIVLNEQRFTKENIKTRNNNQDIIDESVIIFRK